MKRTRQRKGVLLVCLLVLVSLLTACKPSPSEEPYFYWVGGKTVDVKEGTIKDFPAIFPELYLKNGWDGKNPWYKPYSRTISNKDNAPFCQIKISVEEDAVSYDDAQIEYFMMINGQPGNMEVWGVTFDMSFEEADALIRGQAEVWKPPMNIYEKDDPISEEGMAFVAGINKLGVPDEEVRIVEYQIGKVSFFVAYRNGKVYGMMVSMFRM